MTADFRFLLDINLLLALRSGQAGSKVYGDVLAWKGAVFQRQRRLRLAQDASDPQTRRLLEELQTTLTRLTTLAFGNPGNPGQQAAWQAEISKLSDDKEKLERQLAESGAAFPRLQPQQRLSPEQLRAILPSGSILFDFLEYGHYSAPGTDQTKSPWKHRLAAFVVRAGQDVVCLDLGPAEPIARAIEQWRQATVSSRPDPGSAARAAAELRKRLWEPFLPHLKGVRTVLISPDGDIGRFPFPALPGTRPNTCLLEEYAVAVIPVPQLLPELLRVPAQPEQADASLLLLGGIDFDATQGPPPDSPDSGTRAAVLGKEGVRFRPLPGTLPELDATGVAFRTGRPHGHAARH
jgi:hypothetical protein